MPEALPSSHSPAEPPEACSAWAVVSTHDLGSSRAQTRKRARGALGVHPRCTSPVLVIMLRARAGLSGWWR